MCKPGGIFAAGVCLFLFPSLSMPFFIAGLALFAARCVYVEDERLPFRMPLGLSGTDKGDPLPADAATPDRRASSSWETGYRTRKNSG